MERTEKTQIKIPEAVQEFERETHIVREHAKGNTFLS
jgi:hypothetical protein